MAGREKMKLYVYNLKGEYLHMFNSQVEFRDHYYSTDIAKRPVLTFSELGYSYHYNEARDILAFQSRVGKGIVKRVNAIHNSKYCCKQDTSEVTNIPVEILNDRGDVIAIVKSQHLVSVLIPSLPQPSVSRFLREDEVERHSFNKTGLSCRYQVLPMDSPKEDHPTVIVATNSNSLIEKHGSKTVAEILVIKEQELAELTTTIDFLKKLNI
jgi:hypothetical protein